MLSTERPRTPAADVGLGLAQRPLLLSQTFRSSGKEWGEGRGAYVFGWLVLTFLKALVAELDSKLREFQSRRGFPLTQRAPFIDIEFKKHDEPKSKLCSSRTPKIGLCRRRLG